MAAQLRELRYPIPRAQQLCEGQIDRKRMGLSKNRCAAALSATAVRNGGRSGAECSDPLLRKTLRRKRIERSSARHAMPALYLTENRRRRTAASGTGSAGETTGSGQRRVRRPCVKGGSGSAHRALALYRASNPRL